MIIIETHLLQYAPSRSFISSITNECRIMFAESFVCKKNMIMYMRRNYGRALMVTYRWQAEDSTTGVFFVCDFRIDISVYVRLVWFLSVVLSFSLAESSLSSVSHGVLPLSYSVFNCIVKTTNAVRCLV